VIEIEVPPLAARRSDIPLLVAHVLSAAPGRARAVSEEAMALLLAYRWPGNVRELVHVLQRSALLCGGEVIDVPNLPEALRSDEGRGEKSSSTGGDADQGLTLREAIARVERRMIVRALERAGGNRSEAARQLGIGRPHLYAKMEEHGIGGRGDGGTPGPGDDA
jgi:DNA-binding NtrC family response regulator